MGFTLVTYSKGTMKPLVKPDGQFDSLLFYVFYYFIHKENRHTCTHARKRADDQEILFYSQREQTHVHAREQMIKKYYFIHKENRHTCT